MPVVRLIVACVIGLCVSSPAYAGLSFVAGDVFGNTPVSSLTLPSGLSVTSGDLLVGVARFAESAGYNSDFGDGVNTWQEDRTVLYDSGNTRARIFSAIAATTTTINPSFSVTSGGRLGIALLVFRSDAGGFDASRLDQVNSATGTGTTAASGTVTTTVADSVLVGWVGTAGSTTRVPVSMNNFTAVEDEATARMALAYRILTGTVTDEADFTLGADTGQWGAAVMAYEEAGGGGGGATGGQGLLLGVENPQ